jgi:hypothetical protein
MTPPALNYILFNEMNKKKEIHNCCSKCGKEANRLTCLKKYGKEPTKIAFSCSTFHKGVCECCGEVAHVTEARDFFYPDFSLLNLKGKK